MLAYEPSEFDPAPMPFDALSLDQRLLSGIHDLGWKETRPVQSGVIPLARRTVQRTHRPVARHSEQDGERSTR